MMALWMLSTAITWAHTAENVARKWQLTRDEQDAFALGSQQQSRSRTKSRQVQRRDRSSDHQGHVKAIPLLMRMSIQSTAQRLRA